MPRKDRSDILIGNLEKKLGLAKGAIRNPDGTDARSDKKLGTLREEYRSMYGSLPVRKNAGIIAAASKPKPKAADTKKSPAKATTASPIPKSTSTSAGKKVNAPKSAAASATKKTTSKKAAVSGASKQAGETIKPKK